MNDINVIKAREHELPACLALLPDTSGTPAEYLIARKNGEFAGAAGIVWANWVEPTGFNMAVTVLGPARRQGVGRALVAAAAKLANGETDGLWSLRPASAGSEAAGFLEACGFKALRREYYFQTGVSQLLDKILPVAERQREAGRIPEGAEIVNLSETEVSLEEIAWLIAREFNNNPVFHVDNLRRRIEDKEDESMVALFKGELAGVLLSRNDNNIAVVDVRVVAKRWRPGWPNLLLLEKGLLVAKAQGRRGIKFHSDETITDTVSLARRGEGEETDVKTRYYLAFDQAAADDAR